MNPILKTRPAPQLVTTSRLSTKAALEASPDKPGPRTVPVQLKVGWERFSDIIHEARHLISRHHAEMSSEPFNPDWDLFYLYERAGSLGVWTARTIDSRRLVGYIVWIFTRGLHASSTIFATADAIYLAPEWREGVIGYKFLKTAINAVRPRADIVKVEVNQLYEQGRMGVLLERLGFKHVGTVYQTNGR